MEQSLAGSFHVNACGLVRERGDMRTGEIGPRSVEKSGARERKTQPYHDGVTCVMKSRVGECKFESNIDSVAYGAGVL